MVEYIQSLKPKDTVSLTYASPNEEESKTIEITLIENPDSPGKAFLGVSLMRMFRFEQDFGTNPDFDSDDIPEFFDFFRNPPFEELYKDLIPKQGA